MAVKYGYHWRVVTVPRLKARREHVALTQAELAAKAGVGRVTIARLENGAAARLPTVRKLAEALGVKPAELMADA